jgi:hypothetical protein
MVTQRPTRTPLRGFASAELLGLAESIDTSFPQQAAPTLRAGFVGCVFENDDRAVAAIEHLRELGLPSGDIRVGAMTPARSLEVTRRTRVRADISPEDPLAGIEGYADQAGARRVIDRAGVWGAAAGTAAGYAIGRLPFGHFMPVSPNLVPFADTLFFFVVGLFVGSILGAALAPQQSSHAAFRLIDGMHEGALAVIVPVPPGRVDELVKVLEAAGATGISQF